jgi:hypothetical protein
MAWNSQVACSKTQIGLHVKCPILLLSSLKKNWNKYEMKLKNTLSRSRVVTSVQRTDGGTLQAHRRDSNASKRMKYLELTLHWSHCYIYALLQYDVEAYIKRVMYCIYDIYNSFCQTSLSCVHYILPRHCLKYFPYCEYKTECRMRTIYHCK